jgi:predicted thioredoxin/glutaredoxin
MADWVLYSRESCSLCESFAGDLADLLGDAAARVRIVDVASDPDLERRYGRKVPVLVIDGDIVCMYQVDRERIQAHLI